MFRQCLDLRLRECSSLDQLLSASDPVKFITEGSQALSTPLPWLLSSPVPDQIRPTLGGGTHALALGLAALTKCWIFGRMYIGDASHIYCSNEIFPGYVAQWTTQGLNDATKFDLTGLRAREVDGHTMVISHFNAGVYGHWLLECLPKLLYLHRISSTLPKFRIAVLDRAGTFIANWIRHVMPSAEMIRFDPSKEYLVCDKVILPLSLGSYDFHPLLGEMIDELVVPSDVTGGPLYVTREVESWFRFMTNREEIERIAEGAGFKLVSPETLSITDQVALFGRSRIVVGEFGSALHNAMFSPRGARILGLNWMNALQSRISQLRGQRSAFILPSNNAPLRLDLSIKEQRGYHIDPLEFERALDEVQAASIRLP